MDRYLITGFSGFVGRHFLEYLSASGRPADLLGIDLSCPDFELGGEGLGQVDFQEMDLLDREGFEKVLRDFQPNYILHLASYSSVAFSWENPIKSFQNNTNIFLNMLEAVRSVDPRIRILSIGSSEEYGDLPQGQSAFREQDSLHPISPYAVARVSQEMLTKVYVHGYGMDIVMTRSFNHIGPGQKETFAIASFAKRLVEMKKEGVVSPKLMTGDISLIRDFVDVRDVVRAYGELLKRGKKGEVYNICSGIGHSLADVIQQMGSILDVEIDTETDTGRIRPSDNKVIIGSYEKIKRDIGWAPEISLKKSLGDIIVFWDRCRMCA